MLQAYTLCTSEIDRPQKAVEEIVAGLAEISLAANSVGIVVCHYDYVENGIVAALRDALPFPLMGITTFYQATPKSKGFFELTITVLSSDDICFSMACEHADDQTVPPQEKVRRAYSAAAAKSTDRPKLMISFLSAKMQLSGDACLRLLDESSNGVPNFGVVDSGEDEIGSNTYIISEGNAFAYGLAVLLCYGEIDFRVYRSQLSESRMLALRAHVTSATGSIVRQIDEQPAALYLQNNNIPLAAEDMQIMTSLPVFCRFPGDENFISRLIKGVLPDGSVEFMAEIPEQTLLRVGTVNASDIIEESHAVLQQAIGENPEATVFLIASCVGRLITLGLDTTAEMDSATKAIQGSKNYLAGYVGGEICPVPQGGGLLNRYHNNSFIVLVLN